MNNRERLFRILEGKEVDRVPIWLLFPYHKLGCYVDVQTLPGYKEVFEASRKYAVMLNRRSLRVSLFTPEVTTRREEAAENGEQVKRNILEYKGHILISEQRSGNGTTRLKGMLASDEDLEFYCSLPVNTDPALIERELDAHYEQYMREKEEFPEEYGAMMLDLGEPIGPLYGAADLLQYPVWSLTHNDLILDLLERFMERYRLIYAYCLKRDMADVYFMVGSELAGPPMVSRKTFREWIVPFGKGLVDLIRGYGKKSIMHYHGQIKEVLPDFVEMGPDGLHTIEAPPIGNCTLKEAFEITGNKMALIGNIQYDEFRSSTPEKMRAAIRAVIDECAGQRLILSPSAGPFDPAPPQRLFENYMAFMEEGWKYGTLTASAVS